MEQHGPAAVELRTPAAAPQEQGRLLLFHYAAEQLRGEWPADGAVPLDWWNSAPVATASSQMELVLDSGRAYLPVVDRDHDGWVGPGDLVGPAVLWQEEEPGSPGAAAHLLLLVDRGLEEAPPGLLRARRGTGSSSAAREQRHLRLDSEFWLAPVRSGRVMVIGFPSDSADPSLQAADSGQDLSWPKMLVPSFFSISTPVRLQWPLSLPVRWPEGMDVAVALDLDGDGLPSAGDPVSALHPNFTRPPEGEQLSFRLSAAIPSAQLSGDELHPPPLVDPDPEMPPSDSDPEPTPGPDPEPGDPL